jgi:hypothetical protein
MGKTALLARWAAEVAAEGATVAWGTCWDAEQTPALWPWTQVLRSLLDDHEELVGSAAPELAAILPELAAPVGGAGPSVVRAPGDPDVAGRVRVFDAAARLLGRAGARAPVVVILDDLHWADQSTLDLLRFVAGQSLPGTLLLVGAYRPDELDAPVTDVVAALGPAAEPVALRGLTAGEVADLVEAVAGSEAASRWASGVHERSGGHPFFARELSHLLAAGRRLTEVPAVVREVIRRRLARLSDRCAALLDAAAVAGVELLPDVLVEVTGDPPAAVADLIVEATAAGFLVKPEHGGPDRFTHDLHRDTIYGGLTPAGRLDLHHRVAVALLGRHRRGNAAFPADLARHFAAAVPVAGAPPALHWARIAAEVDAARFAFAEAAGHLARARSAIADAGAAIADADWVGALAAEADLWLRSGDADRARSLLDLAWVRATAAGDGDLIGVVALGLDRVGARFAMPRGDLIAVLDHARDALAGHDTPTEAKVTAALARQLQHSVPADRPRARPLAEQAVAVARRYDDPATLASCLLAQHDTLWTPGTATERAAIAGEIAELAKLAADPERHAQALLLSATAQLESGSAAFRATLAEYGYLTQRLRQPRHDYLLRTREAALALLDGDIDAGDRLSAEAAVLGEAVGDSDAGNVRMSQRLEIVRARADPTELRDTAAEAVRWWVGAPAHAHAVAAGFYARAGDLDTARRELDTVLALDDWRADRSYLWSVFIGELITAAIALDDRPLCQQLLDDLLPVADTCAVNGALVCFMGAHAFRVGLLSASLGQLMPARHRLQQALEVHRRLGARAWEAETCTALAALGGDRARHYTDRARSIRTKLGLEPATAGEGHPGRGDTAAENAELRRVGDMWLAGFRGRTAYLRDAKGLHDLAALLDRPGVDVRALELAGADAVAAAQGGATPVLDRAALAAYRQRLAVVDRELAAPGDPPERRLRHREERDQLLAELRRATKPGGSPRELAPTTAERARKAVTARVRDAIRRINEVLPELGAHLDRTIRTGTLCRYDP